MGELNITQPENLSTEIQFGMNMDQACHGYEWTAADIQAQMQQEGTQHDTQMRVIQDETHALESDTRSNYVEATPADRAEGVSTDLTATESPGLLGEIFEAADMAVAEFSATIGAVRNELPAAEPEPEIDFTNQDVRMALREQNVLYTREAEQNMNNPSPGGPGMGGMA